MADETFFNQVRQYDKMALNLLMSARVNGHIIMGANNPSTAVTNSEVIFEAIKKAGEKYDTQPIFLDPGCGYGVPLVLAAKAEYKTYGIDKENTLINLTKTLTNHLKKQSIINGNIENLVCGDMFKDSTYCSLGVSFSEVDIFYLYALRGIHEKFISNFLESAKSGAHLINIPGFKSKKMKYLFQDNAELIHQGSKNKYQIYRKP